MNGINICNLRYINVYSLPRSCTNLFAAINHIHPEFFSINVGGGRYPLAFSWRALLKKSIIVNGEIKKNRDQIRYILRDELKFGFVGKRVTYFSQFLFKLISYFRSSDVNVILVRNPYAIASSMHRYYINKKTHKIWNMDDDLNIELFVNEYSNLVFGGKRINKKALFVSIDDFVTDKNVVNNFYDYLGTYPIDYSGYQCLNCQCGQKFNVNQNGVYCKVCGPISGHGGLNLSLNVDTQRLRDISFLPVKSRTLLRKNLFKKFGEVTDTIFGMDDTVNVNLLSTATESKIN